MSIEGTVEKEITVYALVGDFAGFKSADSVSNIQELSTRIPGRGKYRSRKITDGNGTSFIANVKSEGIGGVVKTSLDEDAAVTAAYFEATRIVADRLSIRDRFVFNGSTASFVINGKEILVPPIDFQVDVFHRFDGRECEWVKIDIEIDALLDALRSVSKEAQPMDITIKVSHLPFKPQRAFIASPENTTEELALISGIWNDYGQTPDGGPLKKDPLENKEKTQPVNQLSDSPTESEGKNDGENNI